MIAVVPLFSFRDERHVVMNNRSFATPAGKETGSTDTGLAATIGFPSVRPVGGEIFLLTSPFIELFSKHQEVSNIPRLG